MSKYSRFTSFLKSQNRSEISLTFEEMESILRFKLPPSAYNHRTWWGNQRREHRLSWLAADYYVKHVELGRVIHFCSAVNDVRRRHGMLCSGQYYNYCGTKVWVHFSGVLTEESGDRLVIFQRLDHMMEIHSVLEDEFFKRAVEIG